jgi:hypothetical protein
MEREGLRDDPAVRKWLAEYPERWHNPKLSVLYGFLRHLNAKPEFKGITPSGLVARQRSAGPDREYEILDALQEYIRAKGGTYKSLVSTYSTIRSFFKRNRAPLPADDFRIRPTKDPNQGRLTVEAIRTLVLNAPLPIKPFYLTLWQGLMDQERFLIFNLKCGPALAEHLRSKGSGEPFLVEFPGRKKTVGRGIFYTFIGRDALAAWKEYFERIRGWPGPGEAALLDAKGRPYEKKALQVRHMRLLERLRFVRRSGPGERGTRYGYNLHEFRDVARTLLHLRGKLDGLDMDCVEFWMGHETDPNKYDKFYLDREYVLGQYRKAEKHLNILSGPAAGESAEELVRAIMGRRELLIELGKAIQRYGLKLEPGQAQGAGPGGSAGSQAG